MRTIIKLTGDLHTLIMRDLARPHPFAAERVGFAFGRTCALRGSARLILLTNYHPVPDEQYIDDPAVGARIGPDALTWGMQAVYHGRLLREGIFHVHLHGHRGETGMSGVDRREIPALIPGFQSVGREAAHGIIILSLNHGSGWVWLPGSAECMHADGISVIGAPVQVFNRKARP